MRAHIRVPGRAFDDTALRREVEWQRAAPGPELEAARAEGRVLGARPRGWCAWTISISVTSGVI